MEDFLNKEFYINVALVFFITFSAVITGFNFDLTVIMIGTWIFFLIVHTVKLFGALKSENVSIEMENSNILGK